MFSSSKKRWSFICRLRGRERIFFARIFWGISSLFLIGLVLQQLALPCRKYTLVFSLNQAVLCLNLEEHCTVHLNAIGHTYLFYFHVLISAPASLKWRQSARFSVWQVTHTIGWVEVCSLTFQHSYSNPNLRHPIKIMPTLTIKRYSTVLITVLATWLLSN